MAGSVDILRLKLRKSHVGAWAAGIALGFGLRSILTSLAYYPLQSFVIDVINGRGRFAARTFADTLSNLAPYALPSFVAGIGCIALSLLFAFWLYDTPENT